MAKNPKVSFIIATYQGEKTFKKCLDSVFSQNYPKDLMEVLVIDGGSIDNTLKIAKNYPVKIFHNKKKYSEGKGMGKSQGFDKSSGEFVLFVDQDNVLLKKNWIKNILKPLFKDKDICIVGSKVSIVKNDCLINRYLSLVGADPFMAPFSIDGQLSFNPKKFKRINNYLVFKMSKNNWYIAGSNGYAYRKKDIKKIGGYTQDSDIVYKLASLNKKLAICLDAPLHHINIHKNLSEFIKKRNYHFKFFIKENSKKRAVVYVQPSTKSKLKMILYYVSNLIIVPNLFISIKNLIRDKQPLWLLHPFMTLLNQLIYTKILLFSKEGRSFIKGILK